MKSDRQRLKAIANKPFRERHRRRQHKLAAVLAAFVAVLVAVLIGATSASAAPAPAKAAPAADCSSPVTAGLSSEDGIELNFFVDACSTEGANISYGGTPAADTNSTSAGPGESATVNVAFCDVYFKSSGTTTQKSLGSGTVHVKANCAAESSESSATSTSTTATSSTKTSDTKTSGTKTSDTKTSDTTKTSVTSDASKTTSSSTSSSGSTLTTTTKTTPTKTTPVYVAHDVAVCWSMPKGGTAEHPSWSQTLCVPSDCDVTQQVDTYHIDSQAKEDRLKRLLDHGVLNEPGSADWTDSEFNPTWTFQDAPACDVPPEAQFSYGVTQGCDPSPQFIVDSRSNSKELLYFDYAVISGDKILATKVVKVSAGEEPQSTIAVPGYPNTWLRLSVYYYKDANTVATLFEPQSIDAYNFGLCPKAPPTSPSTSTTTVTTGSTVTLTSLIPPTSRSVTPTPPFVPPKVVPGFYFTPVCEGSSLVVKVVNPSTVSIRALFTLRWPNQSITKPQWLDVAGGHSGKISLKVPQYAAVTLDSSFSYNSNGVVITVNLASEHFNFGSCVPPTHGSVTPPATVTVTSYPPATYTQPSLPNVAPAGQGIPLPASNMKAVYGALIAMGGLGTLLILGLRRRHRSGLVRTTGAHR